MVLFINSEYCLRLIDELVMENVKKLSMVEFVGWNLLVSYLNNKLNRLEFICMVEYIIKKILILFMKVRFFILMNDMIYEMLNYILNCGYIFVRIRYIFIWFFILLVYLNFWYFRFVIGLLVLGVFLCK